MTRKNSGTGAVPKPLDLERLKFEINDETKIALDEWERGCYKSICDLLIEHEKNLLEVFIKNVKQACEFFLLYYNNADEFIIEQEKLIEQEGIEIKDFSGETIVIDKNGDIINYNEWLFKLAFRGVFDEE